MTRPIARLAHVEVAQGERVWALGGKRRTRSPSEAAAPVAECNRHIVVRIVEGDEVEFGVAVQVAGFEAVRVRVRALTHDKG